MDANTLHFHPLKLTHHVRYLIFVRRRPRKGDLLTSEPVIAKSKSPTTFAKRQREQDKRRKASDKLAKRARRKEENERLRRETADSDPLEPATE